MKNQNEDPPPIIIYPKGMGDIEEDRNTILDEIDGVISGIQSGDKFLYCINCNRKNEGEAVCPACLCVVSFSRTAYYINVNGTVLSERECYKDYNISIYDINEFLTDKRMHFNDKLNIKEYLGEIKIVKLMKKAWSESQ